MKYRKGKYHKKFKKKGGYQTANAKRGGIRI